MRNLKSNFRTMNINDTWIFCPEFCVHKFLHTFCTICVLALTIRSQAICVRVTRYFKTINKICIYGALIMSCLHSKWLVHKNKIEIYIAQGRYVSKVWIFTIKINLFFIHVLICWWSDLCFSKQNETASNNLMHFIGLRFKISYLLSESPNRNGQEI